jgi:hypothetical protein
MWELFKSFNVSTRVGMIGAMLGGLGGAAAAIVAAPVGGTIFVAVFFAIFVGAFWIVLRPQVRRNRLLSRGQPAQATVLAIGETGVTVQENYGMAKLRLRVDPPDGGDPYEVTVKTLINRFDIPAYQPGARLDVVVDPADRNRVAVV